MSSPALAPDRKAPLPGTPVLLGRPVRPEIDPETLSCFGDDRWDLTPGIFEDHSDSTTINFRRVPQPWRNAVKEYLWQLINEEEPRALASARAGVRCSLRSVSFVKGPIERLIMWVIGRGLESMKELDVACLDDYLAHLADTGMSYGSRQHSIAEVRRLWAYRDVVPQQLAMPQAPPWDDAPARELLGGRTNIQPHNRTPRISDATLVPLLAWAIRFVEEISSDILPNFDEYRRILRGGARYREATQRLYEASRREKLAHVMAQHREAGLGLPGRVLADGSREVRWAHLGRLTGTMGATHAKRDRHLIEASGLIIEDDAYLSPGCTSTVDGIPWHNGPMKYDDALGYARLLLTACYIVTAYLSGMRPGEVLNLTAGCLLHDPERNQWTLTGTRWKGATGLDGGKAEEGAPRQNPWVVHPLVAQAVTVAETLGAGRLLFPRHIRPKETRPTAREIPRTRPGQALTATQMGLNIASFTEWVNAFCHQHGHPGTIPNDPDGRITPSRFRRTLAWHIVRRPRGLVAAAIQYGHINVHITQGYAGNYASGFPDDLAFEQWLERIDQAVDLEAYIDAGGHLSGPAAVELERRVRATDEKFSGKVLLTGRQARKLLQDPVLQVHPGRDLHCVFDLTKARCITATTEGPDLSECQPDCANIARTDQDLDELRTRLKRLPEDSLAPSIRHQRTTTIRESVQGIIETHQKGTP